MRVTNSPASARALTYRERGRWTNGMKTSLSTSSSVVLDQVRADAPVLLLEDVIVDPPRTGCLEKRVVEEEEERPARLQHPAHLVDGPVCVVDVLEDEAGDDRVERLRREREAPATAGRRRAAARADGHVELGPGESTPTTRSTPGTPAASRATCPSPVPTSSTSTAPRWCGGQRQDLLGVLGVGPVGECVLPPLGVLLPQVGVGHPDDPSALLVDLQVHGRPTVSGSHVNDCRSSSVAFFTALIPPNSLSSRSCGSPPGPIPSRTLTVMRLPRSSRW